MRFSYTFAKKTTRSSIFAFLLSTSFVPLVAQAATVTLNNGDRISGELLQLHDNTLTLRSSVFGEVKIPWGDVHTLTSDEGVSILLQDGTTVRGKIMLKEDDVLAIEPEGGVPVQAVQRQNLAALNPPVVDASMKYSGKLDVGGAFNRGNSIDNQFNIIGELIARSPSNRYTLGLVINEGRALGVTTTSNRRLLTQYDAFLNDKEFLFASARAESDELAGLDLRASLGAGYGRQFFDSDIMKLSGQVGVNYVRENYSIAPDQSFPTLSIGLKFDREFFDRRLIYFQYMNVDTSLNDTSDTLLRTRLGLRVPVSKGVNVSTQLSHDYVNQPPAGKKNSDTALIFSVGYGF
jgi:putative salt-induced outer membrane protein YdiY